MPSRRPIFHAGGIYHVVNRGVDKRQIFMDDKDRLRFVYDLNEFNDESAGNTARHRFERFQQHEHIDERAKRPLVDILAFALMPNHYHLLLRQRADGGISEYMKRIGGGYVLYFNARHEKRVGTLFQGKFRVKEVDESKYLSHVITYIHANPEPILKGRPLEEYRWSTYPAYLDKDSNWPWAAEAAKAAKEMGILLGKEHQSAVRAYIEDKRKIETGTGEFVVE